MYKHTHNNKHTQKELKL